MPVHFFRYGMTPCQMPSPPSLWPEEDTWSSDWKDVDCTLCLRGRKIAQTFAIGKHGKVFICLRCHSVSTHPKDVQNHFCLICGFHDAIWPPARRWWLEHPDRCQHNTSKLSPCAACEAEFSLMDVFLMTDQPPTCPKCGIRVLILKGEEGDKQVVLCPACLFKYRLESDEA